MAADCVSDRGHFFEKLKRQKAPVLRWLQRCPKESVANGLYCPWVVTVKLILPLLPFLLGAHTQIPGRGGMGCTGECCVI